MVGTVSGGLGLGLSRFHVRESLAIFNSFPVDPTREIRVPQLLDSQQLSPSNTPHYA